MRIRNQESGSENQELRIENQESGIKTDSQIQDSRFFHVDEPYATDVSEGKNNPVYNAHSYHTKVPHPAIMRYIMHYTQPGDIVLDGFAGTGMTAVAAQMCETPDLEVKQKIEAEWVKMFSKKPNWGLRKSIISDLSPIATLLSSNFSSTVDLESYDKQSQVILNEL